MRNVAPDFAPTSRRLTLLYTVEPSYFKFYKSLYSSSKMDGTLPAAYGVSQRSYVGQGVEIRTIFEKAEAPSSLEARTR